MIIKTLMSDAKAVDEAEGIVEAYTNTMGAVSYTHLTLPTNREV